MWDVHDFNEVEEMYLEDGEEWDMTHPNKDEARTLLVSVHNLFEQQNEILEDHMDVVGDEHKLQLIYLRRGIYAIRAVYWLCKHHCYSAGYGQVRFLLELYLVVREWNRNKAKTKQKWLDFNEDMKKNEYGPYETIPLTDYFSGKRRQVKGDISEDEEMFGEMYDRLSNRGSHPHSITSSELDGGWNEAQELDVLQFGLVFIYALAAQYIRTFEGSSIESDVHAAMDKIIVQVLLTLKELPTFLEEDLDFGSQI
jgi:hypothetical protein